MKKTPKPPSKTASRMKKARELLNGGFHLMMMDNSTRRSRPDLIREWLERRGVEVSMDQAMQLAREFPAYRCAECGSSDVCQFTRAVHLNNQEEVIGEVVKAEELTSTDFPDTYDFCFDCGRLVEVEAVEDKVQAGDISKM